MSIDKKSLSERDTCTKFITPAIMDVAGWSISQFLEEFTPGKIHVRGKRVAPGVGHRADYIMYYKNKKRCARVATAVRGRRVREVGSCSAFPEGS